MTRTRALIGFVDLTLILLGSLALIGELEQRDAEAVEAVKPEDADDLREIISVRISNVFEPDEARLSAQGTAWIAKLAERANGRDLSINVTSEGGDDGARLNGWEQAAARTASIIYALQTAGHPGTKIDPQMPRNHASTPDVTISIGD